MAGVTIELTADEAVVLFDWLSERELQQRRETPDAPLSPEDIALASILCQLERTLVEPFAKDYAARVDAARARLISD